MEYITTGRRQIVSWNWCGRCGGEMVSCECEEIVDDDSNYDVDADDYEIVSDWQVDWEVNDNGVGRIVILNERHR